MVVLVPLRLYRILTDTSTHHSIALQGTHSAGQDKTRRSFSGPALVVPVNLPCAAVMRVHGYSLVEELSQCFLMNTQWPKAVLSEGVISQTEGGTLPPPPLTAPPPPVFGGSEDFMVRREAGFPFLCQAVWDRKGLVLRK